MKIIKYLILILCLIYVGVSLLFYIKPAYFLYHPTLTPPSLESARKQIPLFSEVSYKTLDQRTSYGWYAPAQSKNKTIVFLHGNSYNIGAFVSRVEPFYHAGYGILMPEYTGFGGLSGTPNQTQIEQDVAGALHFLHQQGISNQDIILYGYSLGTYLAVYAAADLQHNQPFYAVVLESPFTSLADTAHWTAYSLFPVHFLLKDHYDSLKKITQIKTRLFIGHGTNDQTVPYFMGEKMFQSANEPKTFFSVKGGTHQNLPENGFSDQVLKWLDTSSL